MEWRGLVILLVPAAALRADDELLGKIHERVKHQLGRLPDYVCAQTIERAARGPNENAFRLQDRLRLEVSLIAGKEKFAWAEAARFDDKELRDLVNRGFVATGAYGLYVRHIFHPGATLFRHQGEEDFEGRRVVRYSYEVPWEKSGLKISVPPREARLGFHGNFLVDPATLDLLRLEVIADEIPEEMGIDRTRNLVTYRPLAIAGAEHPFPVNSEITVIALDGNEHRNRTEQGNCRQYAAESKLSFAEETPREQAAPQTAEADEEAPPPARGDIEVETAADIDLASAQPDQPFQALLAEAFRAGQKILLAAGATVHGRIVRVDRLSAPVDRYEAIFELNAIESAGQKRPFAARLVHTSRAPGLIRQQKQLMPVFEKKRTNRFSVLVKESAQGQGILYWDARRPKIKKGFRMRWRIETPELLTASAAGQP